MRWSDRLILSCTILSISVSCGILSAQTTQEPNSSTVTLHAESRLVVLDTLVADRKGKVITNLTRDDFKVYDNGVLQTVHNFDNPAMRPPIPDAPRRARNGHNDWGDSPLTMLVVSEVATPFDEIAYARQRVERYLGAQPAALAEPTILLWLDDSGLHPVTKFTRDRDVLLRAIKSYPPSLSSKQQRSDTEGQISSVFSALHQVALFSRGEPGKKEIIWVGRGFPMIDPTQLPLSQRQLLEDAVHSTIDLLLASRISLYVIDTAVTSAPNTTDFSSDSTMETTDTTTPGAAPKIPDVLSSAFDLDLFAVQTGGEYYAGMNDLDQQIGESIQRGSSYYTLTYVPSSTSVNPKSNYHSIRVVTKDPNLIVQTKQGYYDDDMNAAPVSKERLKQYEQGILADIYQAVVSGMRYTGLGAGVRHCERDKVKIVSTCIVDVDTSGLTFTSGPDGNEIDNCLGMLVALDGKGKVLKYSITQLRLDGPTSQAELTKGGETKVELQLAVPPGTKVLRAVLRDTSGRIGTADADPATIPGLVASMPRRHGSFQ